MENFSFVVDGLFCGVATDNHDASETAGKAKAAYKVWRSMIMSCYMTGDTEFCVCDDWLVFSNYKKWYLDNKKPDHALDFSIIQKSKLYSPETCVFTPKYLLYCFPYPSKETTKSGCLLGTSKVKNKERWLAVYVSKYKRLKHLGTFDSELEAHHVWLRYVVSKCEMNLDYYHPTNKYYNRKVYDNAFEKLDFLKNVLATGGVFEGEYA